MRRRARSESDLFSPCGIIAPKDATELGKFETGSATELKNSVLSAPNRETAVWAVIAAECS